MWQEEFAKTVRNHFLSLQKKNPRYSLRALAKKLDLAPGTLSRILSEKNDKASLKISHQRALVVLKKMNTPQSSLNYILALMGESPERTSHELPVHNYPMLLDWTYVPILASFALDKQEQRPETVARRLGISVEKVLEVTADLIKRKMLLMNKLGEIEIAQGNLKTTDSISNEILQKHHQDSLALAERMLYALPTAERDFTAITLVGNQSQIAEMRREIRAFYQKMQSLMDYAPTKERVYRLSVQLYPIDHSFPLETK